MVNTNLIRVLFGAIYLQISLGKISGFDYEYFRKCIAEVRINVLGFLKKPFPAVLYMYNTYVFYIYNKLHILCEQFKKPLHT